MQRRWRASIAGRISRPSLIGIICVLAGSGLATSAFMQSRRADSTPALIAKHSLAAGFRVQSADVTTTRIKVPYEFSRHLLTFHEIGQRKLARSVAAGTVLTAADFTVGNISKFSRVTVNVDIGRMPMRLTRGDCVDLWATPDDLSVFAGTDSAATHRVASKLVVVEVGEATVASGRPVELQVPASMVARVIQATHAGSVDLAIREGGDS
jgi:hypothetical protein